MSQYIAQRAQEIGAPLYLVHAPSNLIYVTRHRWPLDDAIDVVQFSPGDKGPILTFLR